MQLWKRCRRDREKFTTTELVALRNDLIQGGMVDPSEAAELIQVFLMAKGYGVSRKGGRFRRSKSFTNFARRTW